MKTKAIIFDFDGTLTKSRKGSNCWYEIWKEIDDLQTDDRFYSMRKRNEINDRQWFELIKARYIEKDVTINDCLNIAKRIKLIDGVEETFKILSQSDIKIYILSGGVTPIINEVLSPVIDYITQIEAYNFLFDKNGVVADIVYPDHDPENKNNFVNIVKKDLGLRPEQILFIGNGANDETVYKTGVNTLCINPLDADYKNKKIWSNYIEKCENLKEIINYL